MVKYLFISTEIRKRITEGFYSSDQQIPDEITLAKEFQCSRMTMKKALDILVMEGRLYRKRGHGTFIVKSTLQYGQIDVLSKETVGLTSLLKGRHIKNRVIDFQVEFPSVQIAKNLSIDSSTPIYHITRLRIVDHEPYVLETTYMPTPLIPAVNREILQSSIYSYLSERLELTIAGSYRKIRACKPTKRDQEFLICKENDPILEVEQIGYLNNGIPFEYSFSRHRYDKFVFSTVNFK